MLARDIQDRRFATAFRGYDPAEVRQFLAHVAGLYGDMEARVAKFGEGEVVAILAPFAGVEHADAAGDASADGPAPSAAALAALAEAQRHADDLLAAARSEAQTIVSRANDEAARIVLRSRAESRGKPSAERNAAIDAALAEVPGDPEQAREQARLMISEARAVRERILADLAKRRRTAHVQLEQLRVAREKLLETLRDARRVVEDASRDLSTAEVEARLAAETAGRRVAGEAMPSTDELETELFGGRYAVSPQIMLERAVTEVVAVEMVVVTMGSDAELVEPAAGSTDPFPAVLAVFPVDAVDVRAEGAEGAEGAEAVAEVPVDAGLHPGVASGAESSVESSGPAVGPVGPVGMVDDLFARLRAERTQAADDARQVLATEQTPKVKKPRTPRTPRNGTLNAVDTVAESAPPGEEATGDPVLVIDVTGDVGDVGDEHRSDDDATTADLGNDPTDIANLIVERLARSIKRHLRDEQGSALVALRTSRGLPSVDAIVGTNIEQHARLLAVVERNLVDTGAPLRITELGPVVDDIVSDVRSSLTTALLLARSGSADTGDLPEAIASAYRRWTTDRLDALLRGIAPVAA